METPEFVLFAQHGWADDGRAIASLSYSITDSRTLVVAPSLGYLKTWLRMEPLIQAVEHQAMQTMALYPDLPIRIVGHSMGGLIWLEVLHRHPEWWSRVESIALVASPIGGADLARAIDPLGLGIGIAGDLGRNRRVIAEAIAAQIPMLVIAGDVDDGSDGTITVESTKVFGADFVQLSGLSHPILRNHPSVADAIRQFWACLDSNSATTQRYRPCLQPDLHDLLIRQLQCVTGMTDAHRRDFYRARVYLTLDNGITLRTWKSPVGIDHVFVACPDGHCLYGGFVGWLHAATLRQALDQIKRDSGMAGAR